MFWLLLHELQLLQHLLQHQRRQAQLRQVRREPQRLSQFLRYVELL
jgi:hypothetical protein